MWYHVAATVSSWAPVEQWKEVNGSWYSIEKALQAVSSHLLNKVAWTITITIGWRWIWIRPYVIPCWCAMCRDTWIELEQRTLALEQEPRGPEEPSISDSEAVSDGKMVLMNIMRLWVVTWQWGLLYSRKWSMSSLWPREGILKRLPTWLSSWLTDHILGWSWSTWVSSFGKSKRKPWQLGFCASGTQGWSWCLWRYYGSLLREVEGQHARCPFKKVKTPKGAQADMGPIQVMWMQMWPDLCEVCYKGCVLWCCTNLWFSCRFRTVWKHLESCGWAINATKITSLKGWALNLLRGRGSDP